MTWFRFVSSQTFCGLVSPLNSYDGLSEIDANTPPSISPCSSYTAFQADGQIPPRDQAGQEREVARESSRQGRREGGQTNQEGSNREARGQHCHHSGGEEESSACGHR